MPHFVVLKHPGGYSILYHYGVAGKIDYSAGLQLGILKTMFEAFHRSNEVPFITRWQLKTSANPQ
jgi:hypothetical protein